MESLRSKRLQPEGLSEIVATMLCECTHPTGYHAMLNLECIHPGCTCTEFKKPSNKEEIAVISMVNFRNYVTGYISEREIMERSFLVPANLAESKDARVT